MRGLLLVLVLSLFCCGYAAICCVNTTSGAAFSEPCVCLTDSAPVVEAVSKGRSLSLFNNVAFIS
jgi:hypothetical protein